MVRVTTGYEIDPVSGKHKQKTEILGYAATRAEGMQMLAAYNIVKRRIEGGGACELKSA